MLNPPFHDDERVRRLIEDVVSGINLRALFDALKDSRDYQQILGACYILTRLGKHLWQKQHHEARKKFIERAVHLLEQMLAPDSDFISQYPDQVPSAQSLWDELKNLHFNLIDSLKVGIVSDVHADLNGLNQALRVFEQQKVDLIVCAGDIVEKGKEGDAVVRIIQDRRIPCVQGNHDEQASGNQKWFRENADTNLESVRERLLTQETLDYLEQLPFSLRFNWLGYRVLLVHATINSNWDYLGAQHKIETFKAVARQSEADIIIHGHTHQALQAEFVAVRFYNPGAVSVLEARSSGTCAILQLPTFDFRVFNIATGNEQLPTNRTHDNRVTTYK